MSHNVVTCDVDCVVSTAYCYCSSGDEVDSHVWSYKAWFSTVISCFSTALIGAFRSLLFTRWFVSTFCNETILDNEIMVSFNVESLFTNIPIDAAVQAALQKLENDPSLADRTMLTPAQITDLLTFDGTTTRISISAVIANLYMESFKEQAITTSSYKPRIWKHYVNNTFTILGREKRIWLLTAFKQPAAFDLLHHGDRESQKTRLPWHHSFKRTRRRLTASIYRKHMHTDHYLAYDSHDSRSLECRIVNCLYKRTKCLVTKPSVISKEKKLLSSVLVSNGYPFPSCRNSPRPENETAVPNLPTSSKLLWFYLMSKVFPNSFANSHNRKAYLLFSSLRLCKISQLVQPKDAVNSA